MGKVVHFEIPADEPERALKFYADAFGWQAHKWDGPVDYWMIGPADDSGPGIMGGLMKRMDPQQPVTNVISVTDIAECIGSVETAGGKVVVPKMAVPGIGWLIYFKDTEGNIFGAMQSDPAAA